ncbi:hypothetical protein F4604DRAFT_1921519 [Suillus subluteus]|nr:hypothetical protein F4604DRAFT_1921519 [Suillus subluteus]
MSTQWQPTREQHAWLMPWLTEFQFLPTPKLKAFEAKLSGEWLEIWPEKDVLWPDQEADLELTTNQMTELHLAENARKTGISSLNHTKMEEVAVHTTSLICLHSSDHPTNSYKPLARRRLIAMTQKSSTEFQDSPPPDYSTSSPFPEPAGGEGEFLEEQIGGGRRQPTPPPVQTPTRLRGIIKATDRDMGLVKEASACRARLVHQEPPADVGHDPLLTEAHNQSQVQPHQQSVPLPTFIPPVPRARSLGV